MLLSALTGLIVVTGGRAGPSLRRVARVHDLLMLEATDARQAAHAIRRLRPQVVIVRVTESIEESLKLIRLIVAAIAPLTLIAVAASRDEQLERTARGAGATYYLPEDAWSIMNAIVSHVTTSASQTQYGADDRQQSPRAASE